MGKGVGEYCGGVVLSELVLGDVEVWGEGG